jgi:CMP-N,N'-diacetyllegionaminic acid synthase
LKRNALCIIPARRNSQRLKRKNKKFLAGFPLYTYTVKSAVESNCFEKIILSTDDEDIIEETKHSPYKDAVEVRLRPDSLSGSDIRIKDLVKHLLEEEQSDYDYVASLQPSSPFRNMQHVREAFSLIEQSGADTLVSVVHYSFSPSLALRFNDQDRLVSYFEQRPINWVRESMFKEAFHMNGAIFLAKAPYYKEAGTFLDEGTVGYIMKRFSSLDIDTIDDFELAECIIEKGL